MRAVRGTVQRAEHPVGPLTGTLVLDFGQTAVGPVSTMFLGYLGATVIKVEQPRGDLGRFDVSRKHDAGMTFLSTNVGKYALVLDCKDPGERAYALALIARADVVVDNSREPDVMRRLGLDYFDVLKPANPKLVYLQSSSFQGRGPLQGLPSFEWVAQAVGGFAAVTGNPEGKPEFSRGTAYLDWSGAMMNTIALLAGLYRRRTRGEGCMLSTSQFGTSVFTGASRLAIHWSDPLAPARRGHDFGSDMLDRAFAAADGYLAICAPTEAFWRRLMGAVGLPIDTPVDPTGAELEAIMKSDTIEEWVVRLREARVPTGPVRVAASLVEAVRAEPQVIAERLVREYDPGRGGVLYSAPPWVVVDAEEVAPRPAPELGEHDELVKRLLEPTATLPSADVTATAGAWTMRPLSGTTPLSGLSVVEVGTGLAIGTAGMILVRLGASVTKVLPPWGDCAVVPGKKGSEAVVEQLQHGKILEHLDLARPADRARLDDLVRRADAAIISGPMRFRRTFRLEADDLHGLRAGLVYCGMTGYGASGPLADAPATEFDVQVTAGMSRQLGRAGELPVRQGFHLVSVNTGYAAAQAVLAGLLVESSERAVGRQFEVSLLRTAISLNGWNITAESGNDGVTGKQVQAAGWPADHGYTCRDRQVLISIRNNEEGWARFFVSLDRVDLLVDERFSVLEQLRANEWQLPGELEDSTSRLTSEELALIVRECGGELVPVLEPSEVLDHPQTLAQHLTQPGSRLFELPIDLVIR
jgi:crotonobetainyl-CoA:carnitine CoA-transferase CaiB-like acyl-CoA transferase